MISLLFNATLEATSTGWLVPLLSTAPTAANAAWPELTPVLVGLGLAVPPLGRS